MAEYRITHPEKVLFPRDGFTKQDVVDYYVAVAEPMLRYMRDHPLALLRYNAGIDGEGFFHKRTPKYFPEYIDRVTIEFSDGKTQYSVCNNTEALAYLANHNSIEFHLLTVRADDLWHPDRLIIDFDPSVDDFGAVREAAQWARELMDADGLVPLPLVSGSRGLHIWAPLDRSADMEQVMGYVNGLAQRLCDAHPDAVTTEFSKADRKDRIYIDVARNAGGQHAVAPFSLRAKDGAPAAVPISWDEVGDVVPQQWDLKTAPKRAKVDPWGDLGASARALPD